MKNKNTVLSDAAEKTTIAEDILIDDEQDINEYVEESNENEEEYEMPKKDKKRISGIAVIVAATAIGAVVTPFAAPGSGAMGAVLGAIACLITSATGVFAWKVVKNIALHIVNLLKTITGFAGKLIKKKENRKSKDKKKTLCGRFSNMFSKKKNNNTEKKEGFFAKLKDRHSKKDVDELEEIIIDQPDEILDEPQLKETITPNDDSNKVVKPTELKNLANNVNPNIDKNGCYRLVSKDLIEPKYVLFNTNQKTRQKQDNSINLDVNTQQFMSDMKRELERLTKQEREIQEQIIQYQEILEYAEQGKVKVKRAA